MVVKPVDRHVGFPIETPPIFRRILEMIPGIFTWTFILTPTVVYLITFGVPLLNFFNAQLAGAPVTYNIPTLLGYVLLGATLLNVPLVSLRRRIMPVPRDWPWWRHLWDFLETLLIMVNMLTFGFIPYVQAQTELLLGIKPKRG